jgi:multidrug efflux system outer membrane protein
VVQEQALLTQAQAELAALRRQAAQNANLLQLLVGRPLDAALPAPRALGQQGMVRDLPAGLPSDLLVNRPDILAAEQRLIAANADIGAARAAFFPRIALTASAGTASDDLDGLFGGDSFTWSFVPNLLQPLFDAGRNRASLDLAEVRRSIAVVDYERTIQTAFREVADALAARRFLADERAAREAERAAQAERVRLAELRFRAGEASTIESLDARRALFAAEQTLIQARRAELANAVTLYAALGGGLTP